MALLRSRLMRSKLVALGELEHWALFAEHGFGVHFWEGRDEWDVIFTTILGH